MYVERVKVYTKWKFESMPTSLDYRSDYCCKNNKLSVKHVLTISFGHKIEVDNIKSKSLLY